MSKTYSQDEVDLLLAKREAELYKNIMEDLKKIIEKICDTKSQGSGYWKSVTSNLNYPHVNFDSQTNNKNIS
jgi:hypothetical protein